MRKVYPILVPPLRLYVMGMGIQCVPYDKEMEWKTSSAFSINVTAKSFSHNKLETTAWRLI